MPVLLNKSRQNYGWIFLFKINKEVTVEHSLLTTALHAGGPVSIPGVGLEYMTF